MTRLPLALRSPDPRIPIRPVRISDAAALHRNCWSERPFSAVYNLVMRAVRNAAEGRGQGVVIPDARDQVIGYGQFTLWPACAELSDLVVAEPYRGCGLGTAIIQRLLVAARQAGGREVEIGAALDNPRAAALYRRLGFQDSHVITLDLGRGREQILFLRLSLDPIPVSIEQE